MIIFNKNKINYLTFFQLIGMLLCKTIGEHIFSWWIIFVVFKLYLTLDIKHTLCVHCSNCNPIEANLFLATKSVIKTWSYPKSLALIGLACSMNILKNSMTFFVPPNIIPPFITCGFILSFPISLI
jgi:hypothetical protein